MKHPTTGHIEAVDPRDQDFVYAVLLLSKERGLDAGACNGAEDGTLCLGIRFAAGVGSPELAGHVDLIGMTTRLLHIGFKLPTVGATIVRIGPPKFVDIGGSRVMAFPGCRVKARGN